MLDKLHKQAESLSYTIAAIEQKLLMLAKALNPDYPMAAGFKAQWILARDELFTKEEDMANLLKEMKALQPTTYTYYE
jgi:hypothetical protein